jgi:hypothetical protein
MKIRAAPKLVNMGVTEKKKNERKKERKISIPIT